MRERYFQESDSGGIATQKAGVKNRTGQGREGKLEGEGFAGE